MKKTQPWHDTRLGAAVCWLGSIQFAVPVLCMVAVALGWGTYLESTQDAGAARAAVYGSIWFMGVMALVCVSLIFAVITRYPWKLKHVGFMVVHASLVTLIFAGFWSFFGRIEGHIALEQGMVSGTLEMDTQTLELIEHDAGQFRTLGEIDAPKVPGSYSIAGFPLEVTDVWDNVSEDFTVTDDGPEAYRAVQVQFGPVAESAMWIGDEARGEAPAVDGLRIRVLAAGADWKPPASATTPSPIAQTARVPVGYAFFMGNHTHPLVAVGQEAIGQWKVVSIKTFDHAMVSSTGLTEDAAQRDNRAVEVVISNGQGSSELHTAFESFPDMVLVKQVEGTAKSGIRLSPSAAGAAAGGPEETLVVYGTPPAIRLGYIGKDGAAKLVEHDGTFPWFVDLGARKFTVLKQFTRAREQSQFTPAPPAKEHRPALVIKSGQTAAQPIVWKSTMPFNLPGRVAMLRFKPRTVPLPFSMRLDEFRKTDYPGTDMAMSYESSVTVMHTDSSEMPVTISMNNPLAHSGWKVYQSGFMGTTISIFSVMRDPGLTLTYISCIGLCLGILITFYGRGLTWGHPGVPAPFSGKEHSNATVPVRTDSVVDPAVKPHGGLVHAVDSAAGLAADPGRRAGHAARHVRA